ncbi:MAG: stage III sporulation protein AA [Clostridia bacterium]|nr:stage III sporulation protein AA [Clostridia bacterium]
MNQINRYQEAVAYVAAALREPLLRVPTDQQEQVTEIRLRANGPVVLVTHNRSFLCDLDGGLAKDRNSKQLICSYECLEQTFRALCGYSVHTHQREMVRGYISLKGGHRAGLGATAVEKGGEITALKEISSINIRIARQVFNVAKPLLPYTQKGGLLLVGRPATGKTTLLRDLARLLGGENCVGQKVVLLDERGELAAMWDGIPQNDVGINTDVLNGFSKTIGMEMAVRSLSPDWLICDEIGSRREAQGMLGCMHAGVRIIASVHAQNETELRRKPWVMELLYAGVFSHIVFLNSEQGKGTIERIGRTNEWLAEGNGNSTVVGDSFAHRYPHCPLI